MKLLFSIQPLRQARRTRRSMVRGSNSEPCTRIGSDGYPESKKWPWNEQLLHELGIGGPTTDIHLAL